MMNARRLNASADTALGGVLLIAAICFAVVGFWSGLASNAHANQWYLSAITLGVLGGAVLLDELGADRSDRRMDAALGTLLLVAALAFGAVGWIAGMVNNSSAMTWQLSGLILAVLAMTATMDEFRRLQSFRTVRDAGFFSLALLFGLIGLGLGVVGFIAGLAGNGHASVWLFGGIVSSVIGLAWDFEAEHREVLAGDADRGPVATPMNTPRVSPGD
jgi:hypothetical protein